MCRRKGRHTVENTACGVETTWQWAKKEPVCRQVGRRREWPIKEGSEVRSMKWWGVGAQEGTRLVAVEAGGGAKKAVLESAPWPRREGWVR